MRAVRRIFCLLGQTPYTFTEVSRIQISGKYSYQKQPSKIKHYVRKLPPSPWEQLALPSPLPPLPPFPPSPRYVGPPPKVPLTCAIISLVLENRVSLQKCEKQTNGVFPFSQHFLIKCYSKKISKTQFHKANRTETITTQFVTDLKMIYFAPFTLV